MESPATPSRLQRPLLTRSQSDISSSTVIATLGIREPTINAPERPPRNPARPLHSLPPPVPVLVKVEAAGKEKGRPRTATGTREEVTPWELYPPPEEPILVSQTSSSDSKRAVTVTNSRRPSSSHDSGHSPSLSFADLSILRRRKSTGSKPVKGKGSNTAHLLHKSRPGAGPHSSPPRVQHSSSIPQDRPYTLPPPQFDPLTRPLLSPRSAPTTPRLSDKITTVVSPHPNPAPHQPQNTSVSTHAPPPSFHPPRITPPSQPQYGSHLAAAHRAFASTHNSSPSTANHASSTTSTTYFPLQPKTPNKTSSSEKQNELKFSTADRTILEELKRNIRARAAQFVVKGPAIHVESGSRGGNLGVGTGIAMGGLGSIGAARKHHPYTKEEVPYPRSYDREVLDLDVWETLSCQQICESLTWHSFENPPTKVLDIGCGTGTWVLDCARAWRHCHFVGLDIVPLHPDLQQVGSTDLAHRVTWVQSNFLEGLPFPNEEFDFVHIKRIAMGVPEDKWDKLFEEITRVMKPGAAFEMIEEDLFFPGRVEHGEDSDSDSDLGSESRAPLHFEDSTRHVSGLQRRRSTTASTTRRPPRRDSGLNAVLSNRLSLSGADLGLGFGNSSGLGLAFGNDAEHTNGLAESERENENERDSDSLMTSSGGSRRTSSVSGRISDDFVGFGSPVSAVSNSTMSTNSSLLASINSNGVKGNHSSSTLPTTNSIPPPASPPKLSPKSPLTLSPVLPPLPMINTTGREVGLIVEDEEGERSATQDNSPENSWKELELNTEPPEKQPQKPFHMQESTEATITPATFETLHSIPAPKPVPISSPASAPAPTMPKSINSPNLPYAHLMAEPSNPAATNLLLPPPPPRSPNHGQRGGGTGLHLSLHFPSKAFSQTKLPLASHNTSLSSLHAHPSMSSDTLVGSGVTDTASIKPAGSPTLSPSANTKSLVSPFLFRALPKPPVNPRDHSMLELIYNEMQASRFINLSPLSLLPNLLNVHFKDVRTHPPLLFTFPPQLVVDEQQSRDSSADRLSDPGEDAQDTIRSTPPGVVHPLRGRGNSNATSVSSRTTNSPNSPNSPSQASHFVSGNDSEHDNWVTIQKLLQGDTPYVSFDGSRSSAFSPSTRASFFSKPPSKAMPSVPKTEPSAEGRYTASGGPVNSWAAHSASMMKSRLPNTTMHIDLRSLNLHLAVRVAEILACSESMWDWVLEYQKRVQDEKRDKAGRTTHRIRSRSIDIAPMNLRGNATSEKSSDRLKSAVAELTREEFDNMLRRFYLDMHDHMAIPSALNERFAWNVFTSPPTEERKLFNAECEKYLQWEAEQRQKAVVGHRERSPLRQQRPLSASLATPPTITSSLPLTTSVDGLPTTHSEVRLPLTKGVHDEKAVRRESILSMSKSQLSHSSSSKASTVPPARRTSRAMRVFVAWNQ